MIGEGYSRAGPYKVTGEAEVDMIVLAARPAVMAVLIMCRNVAMDRIFHAAFH